MPGVYYYKIETGEYAGSWVLDTNNYPTVGRQYYANNFVSEIVDKTFYQSDELYDAPEDLNQSTVFQENHQYYTYSPLFVYSDSSGKFK
jgi:hypothetical protein